MIARITVLLGLCVFLFSSLTTTDDYISEIEKMKSFFENEKLCLSIDYEVYSQRDSKLLDSKTGYFQKEEDNFYYGFDGITIIQNTKWNIYVSDLDNVLAIKETDKTAAKSLMSFDEATKGIESIVRQEIDNSYIYSIVFKKPVSSVYSKVKIFAKKSNLTPFKVVFEYAQESTQTDSKGTLIKDKLRLEVRYKELTSSNKSYETNSYFKEENGVFKAIGKYAYYVVIDQRINLSK